MQCLNWRVIAMRSLKIDLYRKVALATRIPDRVCHQWFPLGTAFIVPNPQSGK
jgi:hypothetical protein